MTPRWLTRRWLPLLATVVMTGCPCNDTRVTRTAYAALASYPDQLTACVANHRCRSLCKAVFQLGSDVDIDRCDITSLDGTVGPAAHGSITPNLQQLRGATIEVAYFEHTQCDDGFDVFIDGSGDDTWDDGSTDDGNDDGSTDDGSDDGSTDDGSDDGGDDGGGDDDGGGGGDGGGDDGGGGFSGSGAIRPAPNPTAHTAPAPHAPMHIVH